jgi:hypothetical protein
LNRQVSDETVEQAAAALREAHARICPDCKGTGMRDSGGVHPWGEAALIPCDCADTLRAEVERLRALLREALTAIPAISNSELRVRIDAELKP